MSEQNTSEQNMSEQNMSLLERVHVLEQEIAAYRAQLKIIEVLDETLEEAIAYKWPVQRTMDVILKDACALLDAQAILVRTFDEKQDTITSVYPNKNAFSELDINSFCQILRHAGSSTQESGHTTTFFGHRLDVTEQYLGCVIISVAGLKKHTDRCMHAAKLASWSEQCDNYLASIANARRKHTALQDISNALRTQILDVGLDRSLKCLCTHIPIEDIILTLRLEESAHAHESINFRIMSNQVFYSSAFPSEDSSAIAQEAQSAHDGDAQKLCSRYNLCTHREEALIHAADGCTVVGRIDVGLEEQKPLTPFAQDILERFADDIRERVVDFNKEWKQLSKTFPQTTVRRLLLQENYMDHHLSPREQHVAIMFCDISGFTRLSEHVLKKPTLIGHLIDTWSNKAVEFIWHSGGVFDKMVGDCIIGLWGPPFFESSPQEICSAALETSIHIREYTKTLMDSDDFPQMKDMDPPIGVATGLNFCTLFVGTFGPDSNYTGFSSGMNNTARLQGVATRDEILCMDDFVQALGKDHTWSFGSTRKAHVKNVTEPLSFFPLKS